MKSLFGVFGRVRRAFKFVILRIKLRTRQSDMPRYVELCQIAHALVDYENESKWWAKVHSKLGDLLLKNRFGARAENIELAIYHYQQALLVYTYEAAPFEWARTQSDLGCAYSRRIRGKAADNLEQAIYYHQQALQVYTRQDFQKEWAVTQNNLAHAYLDRIKGLPADNLEQAIHYCQQALEVLTYSAFPEEWAATQNNIAQAYKNRIREKRAENIELAIHHYQQALRTYHAFPEKWALTMNNLGGAYRKRIEGGRAQNIEQAIRHFQQALKVYAHHAYAKEWAGTMSNLGLAYFERIEGGRSENIELAIGYYQQALQVYTYEAFPKNWAGTMDSLAGAYRHRIQGVERGERAENIELAIDYYQKALQISTPEAYPENWAGTMNNLAGAYRHRIRGERAKNIELAIDYYKKALQVYTPEAYPEKWARILSNLAGTYKNRIRGELADNIELAIGYYQQALQVYTSEAFLFELALIENNLAEAYSRRIRGEPAENIEQAIDYYNKALKIRTLDAFPFEWAQTTTNLAKAYRKRIRGERTQNIEQAINYYKKALQVYTRQAYPEQWAVIQSGLGLTYSNRIRGERAQNIEQAIYHSRQALQIYIPQTWPQNCRNTANSLGHLLYDEGCFVEARKALATAYKAVEAQRNEVPREAGRRDLGEKNAYLYARLVFCCLHEGDEEAAFEYASAGKGRAFVDMLATARFDLSAAGADDPAFAADWKKYCDLQQEIDFLFVQLTHNDEESAISGPHGEKLTKQSTRDVLRDQWRAKQEKAAEHWEEMSFKYPKLTATQQASSLSAQQARDLATEVGATLVEFVYHTEGLSAFVVTPLAVHHVPLDGVDDEFLEEMVFDWLYQIQRLKFNDASYWTLDEWYEALITPIKPYLPPSGKVVFALVGLLHLIPLNIARNPDTEQYLYDEYTISFVPSLAALRVTLEQSKKMRSEPRSGPLQNLLVAAYPSVGKRYLPNVIQESKAIAKHFPHVTRLYAEAATPPALIKHAPKKDVVHLSCHAGFDWELPSQSGLELAGGYLTVQRIITELHLTQARLVTLSACQTHLTRPKVGEEHTGLVQAFMTAGARCVVASLWSVEEKSTRALFEVFYQAIAEGEAPTIALKQAMQHVRKQTDKDGKKIWEHPYYWAGFQVSGLGF